MSPVSTQHSPSTTVFVSRYPQHIRKLPAISPTELLCAAHRRGSKGAMWRLLVRTGAHLLTGLPPCTFTGTRIPDQLRSPALHGSAQCPSHTICSKCAVSTLLPRRAQLTPISLLSALHNGYRLKHFIYGWTRRAANPRESQFPASLKAPAGARGR